MRRLIRPALFLVARLGLFLAVIGWIAGQRYQVAGTVPIAEIVMNQYGMAVVVVSGVSINWSLTFSDPADAREWLFTYHPDFRASWYIGGWSFAGMTVHRYSSVAGVATSTAISLVCRHWLIVGVFALFYGVLRSVYRIPAETPQPDA